MSEIERGLPEIRADIDSIDTQMLVLFRARLQCVREVAEVKKRTAQPVFHPERERALLARLGGQAGEDGGAVRALFTEIMRISREVQTGILGDGEN